MTRQELLQQVNQVSQEKRDRPDEAWHDIRELLKKHEDQGEDRANQES